MMRAPLAGLKTLLELETETKVTELQSVRYRKVQPVQDSNQAKKHLNSYV